MFKRWCPNLYWRVSRYFSNILHCNTKLLVKNLPRQSSRATCCRIKHTFTSPRYLFHPPPPFSFFHSDIFFSSPVLFRCTFSFTLFFTGIKQPVPPVRRLYSRPFFYTPCSMRHWRAKKEVSNPPFYILLTEFNIRATQKWSASQSC